MGRGLVLLLVIIPMGAKFKELTIDENMCRCIHTVTHIHSHTHTYIYIYTSDFIRWTAVPLSASYVGGYVLFYTVLLTSLSLSLSLSLILYLSHFLSFFLICHIYI